MQQSKNHVGYKNHHYFDYSNLSVRLDHLNNIDEFFGTWKPKDSIFPQVDVPNMEDDQASAEEVKKAAEEAGTTEP